MTITINEMRNKGWKEVFPGVFEIPLRTDIDVEEEYRKFSEEYGRKFNELYEKRKAAE